MACGVGKYQQRGRKTYRVHRFVWECVNCVINDKRDDNRFCNLQLMTPKENRKKSANGRDYTSAANNHKNRKCVKAINEDTDDDIYYNILYSVQQNLKINAGILKIICEGLNKYKTGMSQKGSYNYKLKYVKAEGMPDNYKTCSKTGSKRTNGKNVHRNGEKMNMFD